MKWTGVLTFAMVAFLVGIFLAYSFSRGTDALGG